MLKEVQSGCISSVIVARRDFSTESTVSNTRKQNCASACIVKHAEQSAEKNACTKMKKKNEPKPPTNVIVGGFSGMYSYEEIFFFD